MAKFGLSRHRPLSRLRSALLITALAGAAVVAGPVGPALASTGQVEIVTTNGSALLIARQADGTSTWKTQTVATGLYGQPAVAQESNGNTVIAAVYLPAGPERGTLYYFWQASGGTTWHRQQVSAYAAVAPNQAVSIAAQATLKSGEAINTEIVAQNATGTGSTLYWQTVGKSPWNTEAIPTVSGTATLPYISVDSQNTTVISYTSTDGFGIDRQKYGTTSWETVQDIRPGAVRDGVQAMDEPNGEIIVAATDSAGSISFYYNKTGAVSDWYGQNLGQYANQYVAMAMNTKESKITLAAFNPTFWDGQCVSTYTAAFGSTSWSEASCPADPGYGSPEDVAITAQPSGYLAMTANASNGEVQFFGKSPSSSSWSDEQVSSLGGFNLFSLPGLTAD